MIYAKHIVTDFDDTLAFTHSRNWKNAKPNTALIRKLNRLYEEGWTIDIYTARGSISCKTRADADKKYRKGIEEWLKVHNVSYDNLSFDKPLAQYYIDDKGILPEDFVEKKIENLVGGLSGSDIYSDGSVVHKVDEHSYEVAAFFKKANEAGVNVPVLLRVIDGTISMEYITHDVNYFKENVYVALGLIQDALEKFKHVPVQNEYTFSDYIDRINDHAKLADDPHIYNMVDELLELNIKSSFAHGDFGITNMLFNNKLTLIDPIPYVFGCTELDVAKFLASLRINNYSDKLFNISFKMLKTFNDIDEYTLRVLIASEMSRVHKYIVNKTKQKKLIKEIRKVLL